MCFVAVQQLADRPFAAANLTGHGVEIVRSRLQIGRQRAQVLDDVANILAVLADGSAHLRGHVIDGAGQPRNFHAQRFADDTSVRHGGVDVRPVRRDEVAHLSGDGADVFDDINQPLLTGRPGHHATQRCGDGFDVVGDGSDLVRDVVHRRRLRAVQDDGLFLRNDRCVRGAGIELDVLFAEQAEVGDVCDGARMEDDVRIDIQRDLGFAIGPKFDVRHFPDAHAGHANGGLVVESRDGVEDRRHFARAGSMADLHVFDLQDEIPEDRQNDQHENAYFGRG